MAAHSLAAGAPAALPGAPAFPAKLHERITAELAKRPPGWVPRSRHRRSDGSPRYTNRLVFEVSPYLQQHAHNPVNWYAWGDEAFAAARKLGRPVLVSIGYSTCHWCHVMEEESFDDPDTAELLNRHFVAIKVDREARPDVDSIYMNALHTLGQRGGWPLNVWLTPDRKPFFGGTYFPPQDSSGRPGFRRTLQALHQVWSEEPERVQRQASSLSSRIARALEGVPALSTQVPGDALLLAALDGFRERFDSTWGGLRGGPKFPSSLPVRLLLRIHRRSGDAQALEMATLSLEKMAAGGIRDHVGGGFHRYATDARWLVPHFEKMLYDNALLVQDYLAAWQVTGREDFAAVAREILDYVAREMTDPGGGFYSATDADSADPEGEMEEGRFFTWTPAELEAALAADASLVSDWFGVSAKGDLEGRSVLRRWEPPEALAARHQLSPDALRARVERARAKLYTLRAGRAAPLRDDKILAGWNGLMISAFAQAALAFGEPRYARAATRAAESALGMRDEGRLRRVSKAGQSSGPAFLEDYAYLIAGLLDLYEAAPAPRWIAEARALQAVLEAHYADPAAGYYRSADDGERLLAREKPGQDSALPSGNGVTAMNLLRLAAFTGDESYRERAFGIFSQFHASLEANPTGFAALLAAADFALDTSKEVLIVRTAEADAAPLLDVLRRSYLPNRIVSVVSEGEELAAHAAEIPLLKHKKARAGGVTAYVCENRVCKFPTADPAVFAKQLGTVKPFAPAP